MILAFLKQNKFPLLVFTGWLVLVVLLYAFSQIAYKSPISLSALVISWDSGWLLSIVEHGYTPGKISDQANVAFFPLYPLLIFFLSSVFLVHSAFVGVIVSLVAFMVSLVLLYKLITKQFGSRIARYTVALLAASPFSYYFGLIYTESLFLLLAILVFWFLEQKKWWVAAVFAGLASGTRSVGVILAIIVASDWIIQNREQIKTTWHKIFVPIVLITVGVAGLLLFMLYLGWNNNDPLAFANIQKYWPGRQGFFNLFSEISYLLSRVLTGQINPEVIIFGMWYFAALVGFIGVALLIYFKEYLYAMFATFGLILPIVSGTTTSINRYILVLFPIFLAYVLIAQRFRPVISNIFLAISICGLCVMTLLFLHPNQPFLG